jgi:hypothetical protein
MKLHCHEDFTWKWAFDRLGYIYWEAESRIVIGVPDDYDDPFASTSQQRQPILDQKTANPLALMPREDGHGCQRDCGCEPGRGVNPHSAKRDVTDDATLQFGHKWDKSVIAAAQPTYQIGLLRTSKSRFVNGPNRGAFLGAFSVLHPNAAAEVCSWWWLRKHDVFAPEESWMWFSFGAANASVSYSGRAASFVGLYEFYITVPQGLSDGDFQSM